MENVNEKIKQIQNGSESAFEWLYHQYSSMVYGICLRYMHNSDDANDLLQEVFVKLIDKIPDYRFEGSFEGWLKKLTANLAIDNLRKNKMKFEEITDFSNVFEVKEDVYSLLGAKELLNEIQKLSPQYKTVFNLYVIDGYKHQEIANMLNISENTSKSNLARARVVLQKNINDLMLIKLSQE